MTEDAVEYFSRTAPDHAEGQTIEAMPDSYIRMLDRFIGIVDDGEILDAGCGHGRDAQYLHDQGLTVTGIDAADGMIEQARERQDGTYHVMDVRDIDLGEDRFAGVWCNTVMQFLPPEEMEEALMELARVLQDDGVLYVTFKLGEGTHHRDDESQGVTRYLVPTGRALSMLRAAGFRVIDRSTAELNDMTVLNVFCRRQG